jgi:hypothetical protein
LPSEFGNWNSIWKVRWRGRGVWQQERGKYRLTGAKRAVVVEHLGLPVAAGVWCPVRCAQRGRCSPG